MKNGGYKLKELGKDITLLYGFAEECCMYALKGRDKVLLVDTGMGTGDLKKALGAIAPGLPYVVVNTHGHGDHSGGDMYFGEVYMSAAAEPDAREALELNKTVLPAQEIEKMRQRLESGSFKARYVSDGFVFDLGGKQIEIIEIPGHTEGCIALLDKQDRLLFSGDCAVKAMDILLVVPQAQPLSTYLQSMKKLRGRAAEYDALCTGHDLEPVGKEFLDSVIDCCGKIILGELLGQDIELPPVFGDTRAKRAVYEDFAVAYRPKSL